MGSIVGSVVLVEICDKFLINVHKDFKILPFSQNISDHHIEEFIPFVTVQVIERAASCCHGHVTCKLQSGSRSPSSLMSY